VCDHFKNAKKLTLSITTGLLLSSLLLPLAFAADLPAGTVASGGLTWILASKTANWSNAASSSCGHLTAGGYTDWHLPTKSQLSTLQATSKAQLTKAGWTLGNTWSSNVYDPSSHFTVNLIYGVVDYGYDSDLKFVSCVR
jgi:hypothetical protein